MIYPKNRSQVSQQVSRSKKSFLNPYQREELKKRLVEKFTKLYGLNNPSIVNQEVTMFFKQNSEINAENLKKLEQNVRCACLNKKSLAQTPAQLPNGQHVSIVNQGPSIVSHGQNGNRPGSKGSQLSGGSNKLPQISNLQRSQQSGIENMSEEDQWAAINKYNTYLFNQEQKLERVKEIERRRLMKEQLDAQLAEKARRKNLSEQERQQYINDEANLLDYENRMDDKKKMTQKEKMEFEKKMRQLQMKEIEERKRFEHEQEKTLDSYILNKIKFEIAEEEANQAQKKKDKMAMMKEMMIGNNERKAKILEQQEQDKREEIELQRKAIELSEELERQRELEFKKRTDRINALLQCSEDKVKEIQNKNYEMEMRNQRYNELREKAMKQKEEREDVLRAQRKQQLKGFLDRQVLPNFTNNIG